MEQKQVRRYRGAMFVFIELCFVTSHRHNTGVPAVHTVFTHVSRYLTTAPFAEITEVTAVFTLSMQNQSTWPVQKVSDVIFFLEN